VNHQSKDEVDCWCWCKTQRFLIDLRRKISKLKCIQSWLAEISPNEANEVEKERSGLTKYKVE